MKRICPIMALSNGNGPAYCIEERCSWCRMVSANPEQYICAILEIAHRLSEIADPPVFY